MEAFILKSLLEGGFSPTLFWRLTQWLLPLFLQCGRASCCSISASSWKHPAVVFSSSQPDVGVLRLLQRQHEPDPAAVSCGLEPGELLPRRDRHLIPPDAWVGVSLHPLSAGDAQESAASLLPQRVFQRALIMHETNSLFRVGFPVGPTGIFPSRF